MKPIHFLSFVFFAFGLSLFSVDAAAQKRKKRKVVHVRSYVKKDGTHATTSVRLRR